MNLKNNIFLVLLFLLVEISFAQRLAPPLELATQIETFPQVTYLSEYEIEGKTAYEIKFKQAIDHEQQKGAFEQRIFLTHVGYDRPTIIVTRGYDAGGKKYISELTNLLNANQIVVEHRYFGTSTPEIKDWNFLTIKQAAEDHHQIIEQFKKIYKGKWLSTGISKGGQTALYHRYFYPNDVAVTVPIVAPINLEQEDPRIYKFLKTVGTAECRQAIFDYQRRLLEKRDELLPRIRWHSKDLDYKFSIGMETAFEYAVLEYSFSFWQWGKDCSKIPDKDANIDEMFKHLIDLVGFRLYNDKGIADYAPHFHQAMTEAGYYGFETEGFSDLIKAIKEPNNKIFAPAGTSKEFKPELIRKIHCWLGKRGDKIIYLYGELDTWSATAVQPRRKADALMIMMKGRAHDDARIKNLSEKEYKKMIKLLEKWLDMDIE